MEGEWVGVWGVCMLVGRGSGWGLSCREGQWVGLVCW